MNLCLASAKDLYIKVALTEVFCGRSNLISCSYGWSKMVRSSKNKLFRLAKQRFIAPLLRQSASHF